MCIMCDNQSFAHYKHDQELNKKVKDSEQHPIQFSCDCIFTFALCFWDL